jgi:AraC-like DNA-binding protein
MLINFIKPSAGLLEFVRLYRIADFTFSDLKEIPHKVYPPRVQESLQFFPRDSEHIYYNVRNEEYSVENVALVGQHTVTNTRFVGRNFLTVLVVFQPGALFRLTGIPSSEFVNKYLDADIFFGTEINSINEKLSTAADYTQMISIVENYLSTLIHKTSRTTEPVDKIGRSIIYGTSKSIDWYAGEACLSHRQFDRIFVKRMGINPKLFYRIARFEKTYQLKNRSPELDWLSVALHTGYYDYQHLVKEYHDFTGYSPTRLFELDKNAPERYFGFKET